MKIKVTANYIVDIKDTQWIVLEKTDGVYEITEEKISGEKLEEKLDLSDGLEELDLYDLDEEHLAQNHLMTYQQIATIPEEESDDYLLNAVDFLGKTVFKS
jgi:hypothetical protein